MSSLQPIGFVESRYADVDSTPLQSRLNPGEVGRIRLLPEFVAGLEGLDGFDYAHMITVLGAVDAEDPGALDLQPTPLLLRGSGRRIGVFATRHPRRPNRLGLSLIRLLSIAGDTIEFAGVDVTDGTPVVDLKPWLPRFDLPSAPRLSSVRIGWYAGVDFGDGVGLASERRSDGDGTQIGK